MIEIIYLIYRYINNCFSLINVAIKALKITAFITIRNIKEIENKD